MRMGKMSDKVGTSTIRKQAAGYQANAAKAVQRFCATKELIESEVKRIIAKLRPVPLK